ncbi:BTAD domain-containing putative transcriptional regulator [Pseudonocardia sp.]|uniref:AfsR/SARP family transcriptional regulator n=1 Tax=Pseudonocardia sp. TaxID=60912 RepID=UPI003D0A5CA5
MEFEILGPVRVRATDPKVAVTARMLKTLLGLLLVRANNAVPADAVFEVLWEGQPVDAATRKKLHLHVHRLRHALEDPGRIRHEGGAYVLTVHPGELDAERFERLLAEGVAADEPDRAVALLREALTLWRGEPFGDVGDVPVLRDAAERLTEMRMVGLEDLYGAELAAGNAAAIVPELAELAARHPLRERLQAHLMTALYRAGRTPEALAVYRRTRAALVEELGVEPGPPLQRLEQAVLSGSLDAAPQTAGPVPAQLLADIPDFVGRGTQITALTERLVGRADDTVAVVAVSGQAGVGKTTLAVHVAHLLRERFPDGQLYVNLRGAEGNPLDSAEVLARFLRALGVGGSAIPDDLDERAALYRSRLAGRRVLVLLDNAAAEHQVRPLVPGEPGCAVLVTSRARLAGLENARSVDLAVLDDDQAVALLAAVAGRARVAAEADDARRIVALCGHLPLALRIAGARLVARPYWRLARLVGDLADEHHRLDRLRVGDLGVRASFALSHQGLAPDARRAFRMLGLIEAADFPAWTAAALLDSSQDEAEELADTLVDARLVEVAGRDALGQVRYRFHDLLRAYARELVQADESAEARTAAVGRLVGGWLWLAQEAGAGIPTSNFGFTLRPPECWRPEPAVVDAAVAEPLAWFQTEWAGLLGVIGQAFAADLITLGAALGMRLAPVFVVRGLYEDWRAVCELAQAATSRAGERWWEANALRGIGELDVMQFRLDDAVVHLRRCAKIFEQLEDDEGRALAAAGLGGALTELGRDDAGDGEAYAQLELARTLLVEVGDQRSRVWVLRRLARLRQRQDRLDEAATYLQRALQVLRELGGSEAVAEAGLRERLGEIRTLQGRVDEAHSDIEQALRLHRHHGDQFGVARALGSLAELHRAEGRRQEALSSLSDALRQWRRIGFVQEQVRTLERLADLHEEAGNTEAAEIARREARLLG